MHEIDIYGFSDRAICEGCDGGCGEGDCAPGEKQATIVLVEKFKKLMENSTPPYKITFYEATEENIARHPDVQRLLSMADLSPVVVLDGKLMFMGGFSAEGLKKEVGKLR